MRDGVAAFEIRDGACHAGSYTLAAPDASDLPRLA